MDKLWESVRWAVAPLRPILLGTGEEVEGSVVPVVRVRALDGLALFGQVRDIAGIVLVVVRVVVRSPLVVREPVLASPVVFILRFVGGVGEALARIEPDQVRDGVAVAVHFRDGEARHFRQFPHGSGEGGVVKGDIGNGERVSPVQGGGSGGGEGRGADGEIRHSRLRGRGRDHSRPVRP